MDPTLSTELEDRMHVFSTAESRTYDWLKLGASAMTLKICATILQAVSSERPPSKATTRWMVYGLLLRCSGSKPRRNTLSPQLASGKAATILATNLVRDRLVESCKLGITIAIGSSNGKKALDRGPGAH